VKHGGLLFHSDGETAVLEFVSRVSLKENLSQIFYLDPPISFLGFRFDVSGKLLLKFEWRHLPNYVFRGDIVKLYRMDHRKLILEVLNDVLDLLVTLLRKRFIPDPALFYLSNLAPLSGMIMLA
jgi:hypothetical protein